MAESGAIKADSTPGQPGITSLKSWINPEKAAVIPNKPFGITTFQAFFQNSKQKQHFGKQRADGMTQKLLAVVLIDLIT